MSEQMMVTVEAPGRGVRFVRTGSGGVVGWLTDRPGLPDGPVPVGVLSGLLRPGDRLDLPDRPNRNRCRNGHRFDEVLVGGLHDGGCPWCPQEAV
jgi:hypothetical protein